MIKKILKKIFYSNKYSSGTYIDHLRKKGAIIGENCIVYDPTNTLIDETSLPFIEIGDDVQIARGVIILGHDYSYSVCSCLGKLPRKQTTTVIGNNVFIGMNAIILMGTKIGNNVIIGAGSVVSGNLDSNSVYAGNPAKKICSLEKYCERNEERFIESARIFAEQMYKKNNKIPEISEMGLYAALFVEKNEDNIQKYFSKAKNVECIYSIKKVFDKVEDLFD